jgi:hypothetical protein
LREKLCCGEISQDLLKIKTGAQRLCINLGVCPTKYLFLPNSKLFFAQMGKNIDPLAIFFCPTKNLTAATPLNKIDSNEELIKCLKHLYKKLSDKSIAFTLEIR